MWSIEVTFCTVERANSIAVSKNNQSRQPTAKIECVSDHKSTMIFWGAYCKAIQLISALFNCDNTIAVRWRTTIRTVEHALLGFFEAMTGVMDARNTKSAVPELTQGRNFNWLYSHFKEKNNASQGNSPFPWGNLEIGNATLWQW